MTTDPQPRDTPLRAIHESLDARLIDFAGWMMPVWYSSAGEEHHAVRQAAGLFDLSHMAELFVTGPAAAQALDYALVLHASAMPVGRARYTMICNEDGGIIDDLIVYRLGDESFMVVANASNGAAVLDALVARAGDFACAVEDRTDDYALIAVQGPAAQEIVLTITPSELAELRYYRVVETTVLGHPALAARTGYTGEDGFELFVPAEAGAEIWNALTVNGAPAGLLPVGLAARDTLRLEAGMPLYGNELTTETTPFDVGAARIVKDKPVDYVGSVALAKASAARHQHLVGLHVEGRRPARTGYEVSAGGTVIGTITSGAPSPTLDQLIAIARVDQPCEVGTTVSVDVRGTATNATVVELPFYTRNR